MKIFVFLCLISLLGLACAATYEVEQITATNAPEGDTTGSSGFASTNGSLIWLFGFLGDNEVTAAHIYNPEKNEFTSVALPNIPSPREGAASCTHPDGSFAFVFGGLGSEGSYSDMYLFNLTSLEWTALEPDFYPTATTYATCVITPDNRVYIFGGETDEGTTANVWEYYIDGNQVTPITASSTNSRTKHQAWLHNDIMYVFGGANDVGQTYQDYALFNTTSKEWELKDVPVPDSGRQEFLVSSIEDTVYIFGGNSDAATPTELAQVVAVNLATGNWNLINATTPEGLQRGSAIHVPGTNDIYCRGNTVSLVRFTAIPDVVTSSTSNSDTSNTDDTNSDNSSDNGSNTADTNATTTNNQSSSTVTDDDNNSSGSFVKPCVAFLFFAFALSALNH